MSTWWQRLPGRDRDGELREEIRSHLEMAVRDRMARGEPRAQAEASARRELGNAATIAEVTRDTWGTMWLERLAQDLRYALERRNFTPAHRTARRCARAPSRLPLRDPSAARS